MNRTELHPIEVLLLAVLLTTEAVRTLAVAGVPLVGALLRRAPSSEQRVSVEVTPPAPPAVPPPLLHPLAAVAEAAEATLTGSTVAQLRRQARAHGLPRTLSRAGRRADLIHALTALEVAMAA